MSTKSVFVIQSNDDMNQIKQDTLSPNESAVSLATYLNKLALSCGNASVDMRINNVGSVSASATVTVSSGAATDTVVINASTLTCVDHRETTNVTFANDSSGNLNSKFFTFQDQPGTNKYYLWFNINSAGVDPAVAGATGIVVAGATNALAATLATAAVTACSATVGVKVTAGASGHIIIQDNAPGVATAVTDGSAATSFTFTRSITGSAVSSVQYEVYNTDTLTAADMARAINASTAINPYTTATSALGVVTVTAVSDSVFGNTITLSATGGNSASASRLSGGVSATSHVMHLGL